MVLSAIALAWTACDRPDRPSRGELPPSAGDPVSPEKLVHALGKDAAALTPPVDPAPPAGDLKAELAHFTTVEACVAERTAMDPVVGDALLAIGYDTFLIDACRVLDASKARDARRCAAIEASSLRAHCETFVAMVAGNPEACPPDIAGDATRGHDPTCIAVSARDPRLCAGAGPRKRAACEALVTGDEKKCGDIDRRVCVRDAARWKTMLAGSAPAHTGPTLPAPKGSLALRGAGGTPDPPQSTADLALDVERGVVVTRDLNAIRLRVGSLQELGAVPHATSPVARPRIGFELRIGADLHGAADDAKIEHLELEIPGAITIVAPPMRSALKARIAKLEKVRGGEVQLVIEGEVGSAPHAYTVHVEMATFVRDLSGRF